MPQWTFALEGGPRRVNHAAIAIGNRIFSFGGYCTGDDFTNTRPIDIHVFSTVTLEWREVKCHPDVSPKDIPYQRYGHTAVALYENVYIWGGRNDNAGSCNILHCFNTLTGKWHRPSTSGDIPYGRDGHSSCLHGHEMFIFGGYDEMMDRFSNEIYSLNMDTFVWSYVKSMGVEGPARWRDFHTATMFGPLMYVFGGRSDRGGDVFTYGEIYHNEMNVFDTRTHEWSRPQVSGVVPVGRRSHSTFIYDGKLYIFGGYNGVYNKHYNTIHCFDPVRSRWCEVPLSGIGPCPRRRQCCCLIGSRLYLFGGTGPAPDTPEQTHPDRVTNPDDLLDHSDLHILDFSPSLKTLCMVRVIHLKLNLRQLPGDLKRELSLIASNSPKIRLENPHG